MRKSPVSYAPRGVAKKAIALRLLAPELAKHESLLKQMDCSSAELARRIHAHGLETFRIEHSESRRQAPGINTARGVNQP